MMIKRYNITGSYYGVICPRCGTKIPKMTGLKQHYRKVHTPDPAFSQMMLNLEVVNNE